MAKPFPKHPNLQGGFAPLQMECEAPDLVVEGEVPRELSGAFFRNGPNPQYAPRGDYHWFGGDGMVHGFYLHDGKVDYRNRWVRTAKWNIEHEAGESLFGAFNPMDSDERVQGMKHESRPRTAAEWLGAYVAKNKKLFKAGDKADGMMTKAAQAAAKGKFKDAISQLQKCLKLEQKSGLRPAAQQALDALEETGVAKLAEATELKAAGKLKEARKVASAVKRDFRGLRVEQAAADLLEAWKQEEEDG